MRHSTGLLPLFVLVVAMLSVSVESVKRGDFKTCSQSSFCVRQRAASTLATLDSAASRFKLVSSTLLIDESTGRVAADLVDDAANALFHFTFEAKEKNAFRTTIKEKIPLVPAFDLAAFQDAALVSNGSNARFTLNNQSPTDIRISLNNNLLLTIHSDPFRFEIVDADTNLSVFAFNERNSLYYEYQRLKSDPIPSTSSDNIVEKDADGNPVVVELSDTEKKIKQLREELHKDMWDESFGGKLDSKPKGPTSIGFDISFPGFSHVYGLPQHASSYALKPTRGNNAPYSEPYRLYNFDVFEYELDNPMALYGSVPFLMAHKKGRSVGVLWVNAAEMWVDIEKLEGTNKPSLQMQDYIPFSTTSTQKTSTSTHWMSESGTLDLLIFLGPTPADVSAQMTSFTGRSAMPQHFAIGYHQSRWNYLDEQDVQDVDAGFDEHQIPYDVLWLDIEHTNGKRYFTWDKVKFPEPKVMQEELGIKGRKMVTIIDPHLKQDDAYPVSKRAKDLGLLVKNKDGGDFDGWCWPGTSYWIDYLNPAGREFWAEQFKYTNYEGSTKYLYTWNDMNEPSVFSGPEITMPKDNLHFGGVEHRDVHNIYGALQHRATAEGHRLRSDNTDRPFVLSRAFFIGTQRYGAIWTGDNTAEWGHLEISIPMLLTIGVSGVTFAGADVGGFFGNPDAELLTRWYQTAAFQPFFRGHAHIDTKRREPWLFGEPYTSLIRESIQRRYRILPYLYTLFWEASQTGVPIMRPLMMEFPNDEETFGIDNAFMLGSGLLVHPVVKQGASSVNVYLPPSAKWYDYDTYQPIKSGRTTVQTPLEKVPTFLKAGTILPRRDRIRRAANLGLRDPYTLIIALDDFGTARGSMYVDDGHSYEFEKGAYIITDFVYEKGVLNATSSRRVDATPALQKDVVEKLGARVERLVLVGVKGGVKSVTVGGRRLEFKSEKGVVVVKDPKVIVGEEWKIVVA